jgi:hypothetical protein
MWIKKFLWESTGFTVSQEKCTIESIGARGTGQSAKLGEKEKVRCFERSKYPGWDADLFSHCL